MEWKFPSYWRNPTTGPPNQRTRTTNPGLEQQRSYRRSLIGRGYVDSETEVASLMSFFYVPKGKDDIRMVYDGTKCGLNGAVWVPSFFLPTMETHL